MDLWLEGGDDFKSTELAKNIFQCIFYEQDCTCGFNIEQLLNQPKHHQIFMKNGVP
jgi:hypothetical protein